jgi:hypothetical protein
MVIDLRLINFVALICALLSGLVVVAAYDVNATQNLGGKPTMFGGQVSSPSNFTCLDAGYRAKINNKVASGVVAHSSGLRRVEIAAETAGVFEQRARKSPILRFELSEVTPDWATAVGLANTKLATASTLTLDAIDIENPTASAVASTAEPSVFASAASRALIVITKWSIGCVPS